MCKNKSVPFFLIFFTCLLSACMQNKPVGYDAPGLGELKRLCAKDAGLKINKTVEAEGYYDATSDGGVVRLIEKGLYRFYEYCTDEPTYKNILEPGCWRMSMVRRASNQCDIHMDKELAETADRLAPSVAVPYREFLKENCIAVEKIKEPTARYSYEVERKERWLNESEDTKIHQYIGKVMDNETGDVMAQRIDYLLDQKKYSFLSSIGCGSYLITGKDRSMPFAKGLIEKTLIPRINRINRVSVD